MKKLSLTHAARSVFFMLAVLLSSCKQDLKIQPDSSVEQVKNDKIETLDLTGVSVKNGVLHFESPEVFSRIDAAFSKASPQSRSIALKKLGFKSMNDYYADFENALNNAKTEAENKQIVADNADFVTLENEIFKLKPYLISKTHFMDRRGIFSIGENLYKFHENGELISQSISDITVFEKTGRVSPNNTNMIFKSELAQRTSCTGLLTQSTSSSNRRVDIFTTPQQFIFGIIGDPDNIYYIAEIYTKGTPYKKNIWGNWVTYTTANQLSVTYYRQLSNQTSTFPTLANYSYSNNWNAIDYNDRLIDYVMMTRAEANAQLPLINQIINNTASTQGNVAATITCN